MAGNIYGSRSFGPSVTTALNSSTATAIAAIRPNRYGALVQNPDSSITIYVGNTGVTSSTGTPIVAGGSVYMPTFAALYAISASGTPNAVVTEFFS